MKLSVVYARYSSDSQTEQSIEGQVRVCKEYAERNGIKILEYYVDRAMTGTNDNRPEFQRMLADAKKRQWDCILVYKFDRFSRNKYESVIHKKNLKDIGVTVVSAMENIPDTPEGIILESLLEGLNQYYSAELSQKVKRGLRESRMKGNYYGGVRPYGYQIKDKKLIIDEKEADVVKFIFKQYLMGHHCTDITKKLRRKKIYYKTGKPFSEDAVRKILRKEYYTGLYHYDGEYFHDIYPPIIQRNVFKKVITIKKTYRYGGKIKEPYIYRGKIFCKQCGALFNIENGTTRYNKTYRYYKCNNKKRIRKCNATAYNKIFLEDYLTSFIKGFISNSDSIDLISKILIAKYRQKKNLEQLKKYEDEKAKCEKSLNNLIQAVENGIVNDTTNNRIKFLESRITELNAEILYENSKDNEKFKKPYIKKYFSNALKLDDYEFVSSIINKIIIDEDTVDIYLNCPYDTNYSTFNLIKKGRYEKTFTHGKTYQNISKEVSVFI